MATDPTPPPEPSPEPEHLKARFVRNVSWSGFAILTRLLVSGLSLIALGRMVEPATMAAFGMGWGFAAIGYNLSIVGAAQGLIAMGPVTVGHYRASQVFSFAMALLCSIVIVAITPLLSSVYHVENLTYSLTLAAIFVPLMCLPAIDVVHEQKNLHFRRLSIIQTVAAIGAATTSIGLAWLGYGLVGLYFLLGGAGILTFIIFRILRSPVYVGLFTRKDFAEVWNVNFNMSANSITGTVQQNIPQYVIALFAPPEAVGAYVYCSRITQLINSQFSNIVANVWYPTLSKIRDDRPRIGRAFLTIIPIIFATLSISQIIFIVAPTQFLTLFGGSNWSNYGLVLRYLALSQGLFSLGILVFPTFQAMGRVDTAWKWNVFIGALIRILLSIAAPFGVVAAAQAIVIVGAVTPIAIWWLGKSAYFSLWSYTCAMAPVVIPLVLAIGVGLALENVLGHSSDLFRLTVAAGTSAAIYFPLVMLSEPTLRGYTRSLLKIRNSNKP